MSRPVVGLELELEALTLCLRASKRLYRDRARELIAAESEVRRLAEFARLVKAMRAAQEAYFWTRDPLILGDAKRLEREVDLRIAEPEVPPSLLDCLAGDFTPGGRADGGDEA